MKHVMLDIEAFGKAPNGCLVEIGACEFGVGAVHTSVRKRQFCIRPQSSQEVGMLLDADTVLWWMKQGGWKVHEDDTIDLQSALETFASSLPWSMYEGVWSNAPLYDFAILRRAFELCDMKCPWHYRQERCSRTLFYLTMQRWPEFSLPEREGIHHRAVDDATYQAKIAAGMMKALL